VTHQLTLDLPPPAARRRDPDTSHIAAAAARDLQVRHQQMILDCLRKHGPLGKDGIAARTRLDGVQVCRRLSELDRARIIEPTGATVPSTSGRMEREWRLRVPRAVRA
jgi:hypothetical protein